jgi:hypothetical protein
MTTAAVLFAVALFANDDFFEQKIRPVLAEKCYSCHNSKLKAAFGGLRLDTAAGLKRGGDSGPVIVAGKPADSLLYQALLYTPGARVKMPPTGRLPAEVAGDFKRWIEAGAPDPRVDSPAPAPVATASAPKLPHWAFQPLRKVSGSIDSLLGKTSPNPIGRREWLRRVTFDVTGLPPTVAELDAYLNDKSDDADRKVVEHLLASSTYGERWARHWLDLVRYCETNGHEYDNDKIDAWQYRDYVIRAFNEDLPYDQLIREHIAGDLLQKPRISRDGKHLESPIGSGMMWFGEVLNSATDSAKTRTDVVDNQVDVISKAFLGLTLSCARCHDHKFDPLPTREYYGMAGVMHSTYFREAVIDSPEQDKATAEVRKKAEALSNQIDAIRGTHTPQPKIALRPSDQAFQPEWKVSGQAFASNNHNLKILEGSLTSQKFKMPKFWLHVLLRGDISETNGKDGGPLRVTLVAGDYKSQHAAPTKTTDWQWFSTRMTLEHSRTCYFEIVDRAREKHMEVAQIIFSDDREPPPFTVDKVEPKTLTAADQARIAELEAQRSALATQVPPSVFAMISQDEDPHDVRVHIRGSHQNLGEVAPRGFIKAVKADFAPIPQGSGRLEMADWIASKDNPLTARVFVNRVWMHHFGVGLVKSVDNFGKMGDPPTNQDLLDFLAQGFMDNGWSVKWLHRQILLSKGYRGKLPVRRLEAEAIRDSILAVSGRLDHTLYGPSITPHISEYQNGRGKPKSGPLDGDGRRSIYINVRRNFITPMFLAFDYPLPISTIGGRGSSTVPSQALLMLNNAFVAQQAKVWADRVKKQNPSDDRQRVTQLYREAFARDPLPDEMNDTLAFAKANSWADLCHVLFNSAEFLYVQ